jgi:hypothetical protein
MPCWGSGCIMDIFTFDLTVTLYRLADALLECTPDDIKLDSAKRNSRHDRPRRPRNSRAVAGKKTRPFANMRDLRVIAIATGACEMPTVRGDGGYVIVPPSGEG